MLRCILEGFAAYGLAHAGLAPIDGVGGSHVKPEKAKKSSESPGNSTAQQSSDKGDAANTSIEQEERT